LGGGVDAAEGVDGSVAFGDGFEFGSGHLGLPSWL
jgi:hypothetical protein